jgi:alpha-glucosidase (family GH31 glycosyl hydrolase)
MHKALVMEYADDPAVTNMDWEYLFGDSMLVAPVMNDDDKVTVYLPDGTWTDYWTKKQYAGRQWIEYTAPLDVLPIFIREMPLFLWDL